MSREWFIPIARSRLPAALIEAATEWFGFSPVSDASHRPARTPMGRRAQLCVAFLLWANGFTVSDIARTLNITSSSRLTRRLLEKIPETAEREGWIEEIKRLRTELLQQAKS